MFAPEEQQMKICLLKYNLEDLRDKVVDQNVALPALNAVYMKHFQARMNAAEAVRSLSAEVERLKLQNMQLSTARAELNVKSDKIKVRLEDARRHHDTVMEADVQEEEQIEEVVEMFENSMEKLAEMMKETSRYYNIEKVNADIDEVNKVLAERKDRLSEKQRAVDLLAAEKETIQPAIPEDLLHQLGKIEMEEIMKLVTEKLKGLEKNVKL